MTAPSSSSSTTSSTANPTASSAVSSLAIPHSVQILFASATGTAHDLSLDIFDALRVSGSVVQPPRSIDSYDISTLPSTSSLLVFVISTCGDGASPRHLQPLWSVLRRADLPPNILSRLTFAVFGLGDRAYPKFNAAARRVFARLVQLGAHPVIPLDKSLGDESAPRGGHDQTLLPWLKLLALHACPDGKLREDPDSQSTIDSNHVLDKDDKIRVAILHDDNDDHSNDYLIKHNGHGQHLWRKEQANLQNIAQMATTDAIIKSKSVITNPDLLDDDRQVWHIELDISHSPSLCDYAPGDVLHVQPRNKPSAVVAFFSLMPHFNPSTVIDVPDMRLNLRTPCTLCELVSAHFDLWSTPRRRFLRLLAAHATASHEREKLVHLSSAEGADDMTLYIFREQRTLLMVLRDFPSARPQSVSSLLSIMPVIKTRAFSIASSPLAHAQEIHLCVARVQYVTPLRFKREGLCSSFFASCDIGHVIPVALERAQSLRFDFNKPALLIAAGTGIAPMRSFLSHAYQLDKRTEVLHKLIFGCRTHGDALYHDELSEWLNVADDPTRFVTAMSRLTGNTRKKIYVQDRIAEMESEVWKLIQHKNARIYVAGAAGGMPKGVRQALVDCCAKYAEQGETGEKIVRRLEMTGRLQIECW